MKDKSVATILRLIADIVENMDSSDMIDFYQNYQKRTLLMNPEKKEKVLRQK